jgi:hypothetical protein
MIRKISEPVSVISGYNAKNRVVRPLSLKWGHHEYSVSQVGLRHTYRDGITRHHVFSVIARTGNTESLAKLDRAKWDNCLFFRLNLNTDNLAWTLEEVSDGLPD